jgi:hypothetical protein
MSESMEPTTPHFLYAAGIDRQQLQALERSGVLAPVKPGGYGPGNAGTWTPLQAVGAALWQAFLRCGLHSSWAREACRWVCQQKAGPLEMQLARGRTFLVLSSDGSGKLVKPNWKANPANRLKYGLLNLARIYHRVIARLIDCSPEPDRPALRGAYAGLFEMFDMLAEAEEQAAGGTSVTSGAGEEQRAPVK